MTDINADLDWAYRQTRFWIGTKPPLYVCVGQPCPDFLLRQPSHGAMGGIWITAHNPQSQQVADSVNQKAHQSLVCELEKAGHSMTDAWSEDPQGHWPSEVGVFVWGMSVDEGIVWGRAYDQAAVLTVDPQGMSDLVWIT